MAFHQNSPYWTEHNYPCGYFSYSHPISTTTTTTTTTRNDDKKNHLIEQFANYIQDIISICRRFNADDDEDGGDG